MRSIRSGVLGLLLLGLCGCASVTFPLGARLDNQMERTPTPASLGELASASPGDPFRIEAIGGTVLQGTFLRFGQFETGDGMASAVLLRTDAGDATIPMAQIRYVERLHRPRSVRRALALGAGIDAILVGLAAYLLVSGELLDGLFD